MLLFTLDITVQRLLEWLRPRSAVVIGRPGCRGAYTALQQPTMYDVRPYCRPSLNNDSTAARHHNASINLFHWSMTAVLCCATSLLAEPTTPRIVLDPSGDDVPRRVDPGADGVLDLGIHKLPDLTGYSIGPWKPLSPDLDLYVGDWDTEGGFFRLDITFAGVVNPPGPIGVVDTWNPFKYGPNPVYGYVEVDMDNNLNTGGELISPQVRYNGNALRFGGRPIGPRFTDRLAAGAGDFDGNIATSPLVDRSGEDFHLALNGWQIDANNILRTDQSDIIVGPGETWLFPGRLWHRAHGYEPFSHACCIGQDGQYEARITLRFKHEIQQNRTTITFVYPMTNEASLAMGNGTTLQILDGDPINQNSVLEGLDDLVFGTHFPNPGWTTHPNYGIIAAWTPFDLYDAPNNVSVFLTPKEWEITALVGGNYAVTEGAIALAYSDLMPNVLAGDFNANNMRDQADLKELYTFIANNDGVSGVDADQTVDQRVKIINFGPNFNIYDVNYDGFVDYADHPGLTLTQCPGGCAPPDFDRDGDVDMDDFGHYQGCVTGAKLAPPADTCYDADLDHDFDVDQADYGHFQVCLSGSGVVASPSCMD